MYAKRFADFVLSRRDANCPAIQAHRAVSMKAQGEALGNEIDSGIPASTRRPQWSRTGVLGPPRWGWIMIRLPVPGLHPGL